MDRPIHLSDFEMTQRSPHTEASVIVPVWITQSALDGMLELMKFIEGLQAGGSIGNVPGAFDLAMFYRRIGNALRGAEDEYRREAVKAAPIEDDEPILGDTMIRHTGTIYSHSGPCTMNCPMDKACP